MARRKPKSSKFTTEELLAILDKTPLEKAKESDVYKYIQDHKFKAGTKLYPNSVLYYMYLKDNKYKKLTRRGFFKFFSEFFTVKIFPYYKGYMLEETMSYTEEDYIQSRILTRKEKYEKKKQPSKVKKENS